MTSCPRARVAPRDLARLGAMLALWAAAELAAAAEIAVVGLFPGKAVLIIDGGSPRTVAVGSRTPEGVRLIAIDGETATVELEGKRQQLGIGQSAVAQGNSSGNGQVTLTSDIRGHFIANGTVNGAAVRFIVDTGATMISLSAADAGRAGIDYRRGEPVMTMTANGPAQAWKTRLSSVKIGDIQVNDVDALVHTSDMPLALLGMSFLNRMEMRRDGQTMTLRKRY